MKILFFHGLEGSPEGIKAKHLRVTYNASTPSLTTTPLCLLRDINNKSWAAIDNVSIHEALALPFQQAIDAMLAYSPDIIVGSSFGGALLAKMIEVGVWSGPSLFLASAGKILLGIDGSKWQNKDVPTTWIHGVRDVIIPVEHSIEAAQKSRGKIILVDDDHRLDTLIPHGYLDNEIIKLYEEI